MKITFTIEGKKSGDGYREEKAGEGQKNIRKKYENFVGDTSGVSRPHPYEATQKHGNCGDHNPYPEGYASAIDDTRKYVASIGIVAERIFQRRGCKGHVEIVFARIVRGEPRGEDRCDDQDRDKHRTNF